MQEFTDYYALLGVPPEADEEDLARAWRKLSFRWHPDRNQARLDEAHERFLLLGEAYAVLSDPNARSRFDRARRRALGEPAAAGGRDQRGSAASGSSRFDNVVREACKARAATAWNTGKQATFEQQVLVVMRELAAAQLSGRSLTRTAQVLHLTAIAASFFVAYGLFLLLAADTEWRDVDLMMLASPVPIVVTLAVMRIWTLALRDRRLAECFRPVAEKIVRRRRSRSVR